MSEVRVTEILTYHGLIDTAWFKSKHSRRGRLTDHACNLLGRGLQIEAEWWKRASGSPDPALDDWVAHEDCRPYIEQYQKAQAEIGFTVTHAGFEQLTLRNSVYGYVGHADQVWTVPSDNEPPWLVDLKTGGTSEWHRLQLGLYKPAAIETLKIVPVCYNLYLNPDGYKLVKRDDPRDVKEALILAQSYHVLKKWRQD